MNTQLTWKTLKIIGSSRIVGFTAIVPFLGYLLLFNENIIHYFFISPKVIESKTVLEESISRLYYLYFGLSFLGLSSILFALVCPIEIKELSSEYEYIEKEIKVMTHERLHILTEVYINKITEGSILYKELSSYVSHYNDAGKIAEEAYWNDEAGRAAYKKEIIDSSILNILKFDWSFKNQRNPRVRITIACGYIVGFILIAIPSISVSMQLIISLTNKITA